MTDEPKKRDLKTDALNGWTWNAEQPVDSLNRLRDACIGFAADVVDWYNREKNQKRRIAKLLRSSAIVIAGISALLLLCSQREDTISPGWATAAIIVAGTLVAIDRFFGYTNAWIRFIESAHEIRVLLRGFRLDWEQQASRWENGQPSDKQIADAIKRARRFVAAVDEAVTDEINDWATQFRSSLSRHNAKLAAALEEIEGGTTPGAGGEPQPGRGGAPAPAGGSDQSRKKDGEAPPPAE